MKPVVFISHIHDEANVAKWLKESILRLLLGGIDFFVSSDRTAIIGGDRWLNKIEDALRNSPVVLVLCSEKSVLRPWINFEAGGAWIAGKRVVPICHEGMEPSHLPEPLKSLQAYNLKSAQDYLNLVELLANEAGLNMPEFDFEQTLKDIPPSNIKQGLVDKQSFDIISPNQGDGPVSGQPVEVEIGFDRLRNYQQLQKYGLLHRYGLSMSVFLKETPDQDFFRVALLWPEDIKIEDTGDLEQGEKVEVDGVIYQELAINV